MWLFAPNASGTDPVADCGRHQQLTTHAHTVGHACLRPRAPQACVHSSPTLLWPLGALDRNQALQLISHAVPWAYHLCAAGRGGR